MVVNVKNELINFITTVKLIMINVLKNTFEKMGRNMEITGDLLGEESAFYLASN